MTRLTAAAFGSLVVALAFVQGCSITIKTKNRFAQEGETRTAEADWAGEAIAINADGVGVSVNGGLQIIADPNATRVKAVSRLLAMADADDETNAKLSIEDAKGTFTISTANGTTTIACHHGSTHGTSDSGSSGCEQMTVTIPAGSATQPLSVNGASGNGGLTVSASGAYFKSLQLNSSGGDVDVVVDSNPGATLAAVAVQGDNVTFHLPSSFAADKIVLSADPDKIDTSAFADITNDGGRGTAGTGAAQIALTSTPFAGSSGKVVLASR